MPALATAPAVGVCASLSLFEAFRLRLLSYFTRLRCPGGTERSSAGSSWISELDIKEERLLVDAPYKLFLMNESCWLRLPGLTAFSASEGAELHAQT